mgnify:CR=1 FL=1
MKKEEYLKPEMKVILLRSKSQLLAGSMGIYNEEVDDEQYIL